jgi:5-methylcytosine-specific restriction enzyme subunit McrC
MAAERYGRHDARDKLMVSAARLALDLSLPTEAAGRHDLWLPDREEAWVRRLFERGVGGLYEVALCAEGWSVSRGASLDWPVEAATAGIDPILPSMRTDIALENAGTGQCLVIDTKFTRILTAGWYRDESLRSGYLYQMYAYLRSQVGCGDLMRDRASGLLLHPAVGCDVDETVVIQGHAIRFATVDLTGRPQEIRDRLLGLAKPPPFGRLLARHGR